MVVADVESVVIEAGVVVICSFLVELGSSVAEPL